MNFHSFVALPRHLACALASSAVLWVPMGINGPAHAQDQASGSPTYDATFCNSALGRSNGFFRKRCQEAQNAAAGQQQSNSAPISASPSTQPPPTPAPSSAPATANMTPAPARTQEPVAQMPAQPAATAAPIAPPSAASFMGKVTYKGTYAVEDRTEDRRGVRVVPMDGAITIEIEFDEAAVKGSTKTTGLVRSGKFSGSTSGNQCKVYTRDIVWTGLCDREQLRWTGVTLNPRSGRSMSGTIVAKASEVIDYKERTIQKTSQAAVEPTSQVQQPQAQAVTTQQISAKPAVATGPLIQDIPFSGRIYYRGPHYTSYSRISETGKLENKGTIELELSFSNTTNAATVYFEPRDGKGSVSGRLVERDGRCIFTPEDHGSSRWQFEGTCDRSRIQLKGSQTVESTFTRVVVFDVQAFSIRDFDAEDREAAKKQSAQREKDLAQTKAWWDSLATLTPTAPTAALGGAKAPFPHAPDFNGLMIGMSPEQVKQRVPGGNWHEGPSEYRDYTSMSISGKGLLPMVRSAVSMRIGKASGVVEEVVTTHYFNDKESAHAYHKRLSDVLRRTGDFLFDKTWSQRANSTYCSKDDSVRLVLEQPTPYQSAERLLTIKTTRACGDVRFIGWNRHKDGEFGDAENSYQPQIDSALFSMRIGSPTTKKQRESCITFASHTTKRKIATQEYDARGREYLKDGVQHEVLQFVSNECRIPLTVSCAGNPNKWVELPALGAFECLGNRTSVR